MYTPLDWGCRCTVIPGIARNVSKEYDSDWANKVVDPLVKNTIFDNNAALTGKIFTELHPYFKGKEIESTNQLPKRYDKIDFKAIKTFKNDGKIEEFTTGKQNPQETTKNKIALMHLAKNGGQYRLLPVVEDGLKNPDAFNLKTFKMVDIKVSESTNGKNIIQSALKEASKQGV